MRKQRPTWLFSRQIPACIVIGCLRCCERSGTSHYSVGSACRLQCTNPKVRSCTASGSAVEFCSDLVIRTYMLLSSAIVSAVGTHGAATKGHTYHWHKGIDSIAALLSREVHTAGGVSWVKIWAVQCPSSIWKSKPILDCSCCHVWNCHMYNCDNMTNCH
jgi:hypothetical protein